MRYNNGWYPFTKKYFFVLLFLFANKIKSGQKVEILKLLSQKKLNIDQIPEFLKQDLPVFDFFKCLILKES